MNGTKNSTSQPTTPNNITYAHQCSAFASWQFIQSGSSLYSIFTIPLAAAVTVFNLITAFAIFKTMKGHIRLFDVANLNLNATFLILANALYIAYSLASFGVAICATQTIIGVSFIGLTFLKMLSLITISLNQAKATRSIQSGGNQPIKYKKMVMIFVAIWLLASILTLGVHLFPETWVFQMVILIALLVAIRAYVIKKLPTLVNIVSGDAIKETLLKKIRKSKGLVKAYIMIDIMSWCPAAIAVIVTRALSVPVDALHIVVTVRRLAMLPLLTSPLLYPIMTVYGDPALSRCVRTLITERFNDNETQPRQPQQPLPKQHRNWQQQRQQRPQFKKRKTQQQQQRPLSKPRKAWQQQRQRRPQFKQPNIQQQQQGPWSTIRTRQNSAKTTTSANSNSASMNNDNNNSNEK